MDGTDAEAKLARCTKTLLEADAAGNVVIVGTEYSGFSVPRHVPVSRLVLRTGSILEKNIPKVNEMKKELAQKYKHRPPARSSRAELLALLAVQAEAKSGVVSALGKVAIEVAKAQVPPPFQYEATHATNARAEETIQLSAPGEGRRSKEQVQKGKKRRVQKQADGTKAEADALQEEKTEAGLLCCDAVCPTTHRRCEWTTLFPSHHQRHVSGESGRNTFVPHKGHGGSGTNALDVIARMAAKPGSNLAAGANPNKLGPGIDAVPSSVASPAARATAAAVGQFRKPAKSSNYTKPKRLLNELERMYKIGEQAGQKKWTAVMMHESMQKKTDADGSLFFCWEKRGMRLTAKDVREGKTCGKCGFGGKGMCECNGMLLTVGQIQGWMNQRSSRGGVAAVSDDA